MRTVLDEAKTWFLDAIVYRRGDLRIVIAEGFRSDEPEDLIVGEINAGPVYSIDVRYDSRKFAVTFPRFVAWQVVEESFTCRDESEARDDNGFLQTLERSRYLEYVTANHGWFREVVGPAKHYRLWTENEVLDIVAFDEPRIEECASDLNC